MLKGIAIKNFIHFRDRQKLTFENGANFIIGANSSGKTSIFELIRRCLSFQQNTSTSSIFDKSKPAYAVCKYEIKEEFTDTHVNQSIRELTGFSPKEIYVATVANIYQGVQHGEKSNGKQIETPDQGASGDQGYYKEDHYKLLSISDGNTNYISLCDSFRVNKTDPIYLHNVAITSVRFGESKFIWECLQNLFKEGKQDFDTLNEIIERFSGHNLGGSTGDSSTLTCEKLLSLLFEKCVVLTFPMRSIGPLQWSFSKKICHKDKEINYEEARDKAEILNTLLLDPWDPEEERAFNTIIGSSLYKIKRDDKDMETPLLKLPEGVLEGKQLTLLLYHKEYQTLCLEEPDRGMNTRMIEKVRDLVLRKVKNKVVIITSHHPAIMSPWSIRRTHVCRRKRESKDTVIHYVVNAKDVNKPNYLASDELKKILYASHVLVVEGPSDKLILEAIFEHILDGNEKVTHIVGESCMERLQTYVSLIEIVVQDGCCNESKLRTIFGDFDVPFLILSDLDVHVKVQKKGKLEIHTERLINKYLFTPKGKAFVESLKEIANQKVTIVRELFKFMSNQKKQHNSESFIFADKFKGFFKRLFENESVIISPCVTKASADVTTTNSKEANTADKLTTADQTEAEAAGETITKNLTKTELAGHCNTTTSVQAKLAAKSTTANPADKTTDPFDAKAAPNTADPFETEAPARAEESLQFCQDALTRLKAGLNANTRIEMYKCVNTVYQLFVRNVCEDFKESIKNKQTAKKEDYTHLTSTQLSLYNEKLKEKNIFMWNNGSLEDVVNDSILCDHNAATEKRIDLAYKHWVGDGVSFPIIKRSKGDTTYIDGKRKLLDITYEIVNSLAELMLDTCDVKRFILLLNEKSKEETDL